MFNSIKPQTNVNHEDEKKGKHKLSTAALNNPLKPKGKINYNKYNNFYILIKLVSWLLFVSNTII